MWTVLPFNFTVGYSSPQGQISMCAILGTDTWVKIFQCHITFFCSFHTSPKDFVININVIFYNKNKTCSGLQNRMTHNSC